MKYIYRSLRNLFC